MSSPLNRQKRVEYPTITWSFEKRLHLEKQYPGKVSTMVIKEAGTELKKFDAILRVVSNIFRQKKYFADYYLLYMTFCP
jgi:hypothetical protein